MTMLIDASGSIADGYVAVSEPEALARTGGAVLVPLALLPAALAAGRNAPVGVAIANRTPLEEIAPYFGALSLVAIEFPSFSDGTGFSLARRLRREGFAGRLRASGPLIADQLPEALACGFDEIELPAASAARQPSEQWVAADNAITAHYQTGYGSERSILQQRLDARRNG